ncbi:MAG: hypothetical protein ACJAR6_000852 [Oleispira sp.]|jgi:hypothetical protein
MRMMHISLGITLLGTVLLSGCNYSSGSSNATVVDTPQIEKFSELSRAAFAQASESEPLQLNGLTILNDVTSANFYDDLLSDGAEYSR